MAALGWACCNQTCVSGCARFVYLYIALLFILHCAVYLGQDWLTRGWHCECIFMYDTAG